MSTATPAAFLPPINPVPGPRKPVELANPLGVHVKWVDGWPRVVVPLEHGDVTIWVQTVDGEQAQAWLTEYNTHNRERSKERTKAHVRDMEADNWVFTGDAIRFAYDANGKPYMADGQHRLTAIEESGIAQLCLIVWGLSDDAQEVIDTGMLRTIANSLSLQRDDAGEKRWTDPASVGTIARRLLMWDSGQVPGLYTSGASRKFTKTEVLRYAAEHAEEITEALKVVRELRKNGFTVPGTVIATAYAVLARIDKTGADIFVMEQLIKGLGIDHDDDPAKRLRERLTRTDKWRIESPGEAFMLTLKAWNHWRGVGGAPMRIQKLQAPRGGWPKPSEFVVR